MRAGSYERFFSYLSDRTTGAAPEDPTRADDRQYRRSHRGYHNRGPGAIRDLLGGDFVIGSGPPAPGTCAAVRAVTTISLGETIYPTSLYEV